MGFKKIRLKQSQTGGAGVALYKFAANRSLTRLARMKRMGFYVKCLSAEIHTDPFFHRAGGFGSCCDVVFVCVCVCCVLMSVYLFSTARCGGRQP